MIVISSALQGTCLRGSSLHFHHFANQSSKVGATSFSVQKVFLRQNRIHVMFSSSSLRLSAFANAVVLSVCFALLDGTTLCCANIAQHDHTMHPRTILLHHRTIEVKNAPKVYIYV